jgi:hypothetical protein
MGHKWFLSMDRDKDVASSQKNANDLTLSNISRDFKASGVMVVSSRTKASISRWSTNCKYALAKKESNYHFDVDTKSIDALRATWSIQTSR